MRESSRLPADHVYLPRRRGVALRELRRIAESRGKILVFLVVGKR